jgi:hypothetical protein
MLVNMEARSDELPADLVPALPRARACPHANDDGPLLVLRSDGDGPGSPMQLDGMDLADAEALGTTLKLKASLWKAITPDKPFPARLRIAASVRAPIDRVASLLRVIRDAGFTHILAIEVEHHQSLRTYTLGEVPYAPRACAIEMVVLQGSPRTWGDTVAANHPVTR